MHEIVITDTAGYSEVIFAGAVGDARAALMGEFAGTPVLGSAQRLANALETDSQSARECARNLGVSLAWNT